MALVLPASGSAEAVRPTLGSLLGKLCGDAALFALGISIARVVELASTDDQGAASLSYFVLADVALTQKILRVANTPAYRTANGGAVTTISRAIALLGFENVKVVALAMLLVDTLASSRHADSVRAELELALCASLVGRAMARRSPYQGAEEVAIAALFKNIAPLLIASQEHARYQEIAALRAQGQTTAQAAHEVLGCSYDTLATAVLREWKIPEAIVRAQSPLSAAAPKPAPNRAEWMRQVTAFSLDTARLLAGQADAAGSAATPAAQVAQVAQRYATALGLDEQQVHDLCETVRQEVAALLEGLNLAPALVPATVIATPAPAQAPTLAPTPTLTPVPAPAAGPGAVAGLPDALRGAAMQGGTDSAAFPSGKPANAREVLLAGLQQAVLLRAGGPAKVGALINLVLETLCRGMGFRFAVLCLKDVASGQFRARMAYGEALAPRQAGFVFPLAPSEDLFHLAMRNDADLMIADAGAANIAQLLPAWHRSLLPDTRSLMVLPLVLHAGPVGLFYADRGTTAPEGVPPDETALIRALKEQVLQALGR